MSTKYKATTTENAYFITITVVGWIDIFTRVNQKKGIIKALQYCQRNKGLEIYAYCIMSSHIHMLCKATNGFILSDVMRDFKKFTPEQAITKIGTNVVAPAVFNKAGFNDIEGPIMDMLLMGADKTIDYGRDNLVGPFYQKNDK